MNDIVDRLRGQEPLHLGDRSAAADVIERLRAELAECKRDAELWRAYQARKQAVIDAGMASNPMLAVAANMMCPFCHSMIGAPHELWCRHSALAAKGE